jgi:hypothetical protein
LSRKPVGRDVSYQGIYCKAEGKISEIFVCFQFPRQAAEVGFGNRPPCKQPSDQPVVEPVHHTLFVCVIFMRKKSVVVKFVPKDFVVIVFLGIPMPTVRTPCK